MRQPLPRTEIAFGLQRSVKGRTLARFQVNPREIAMGILWTIIIGFAAGLIAKFLHPGNKNEPSDFILTTLLGIAGAFAATFLGQAIGWYKAGEGAGFIGAIVGAIIVLVVWGIFANRRAQRVKKSSKFRIFPGRLHPRLFGGRAAFRFDF